jgi:ankyrin repeat protein
LMDASRPGHFEVVKLLLTKGADVHAENDRKVTALGMASLKDQTRVLGLLSESGAKDKGIGYERMALLGAAFDDDAKRVRMLIEKGVDASLKGEALISASFFGSTDLVKMLLENGADVNTKDSKGQTALGIATIMDRTDVIELLKAHGAK